MKKKVLVFSVAMLLAFGFSSCSSDTDVTDTPVAQDDILTFEEGMKFKNVIDSVSKISNPVIRKGKTRAVNADMPDDIILTKQDSLVLEQQGNAMIEASIDMYKSMGFTEEELFEIVGEDNREVLATTALVLMSAVHDEAIQTRGITGNKYLDCALEVTGFDMLSILSTGITHGVSKAVAKKFLKKVLMTTVGGPYGVTLTIGFWGMCIADLI